MVERMQVKIIADEKKAEAVRELFGFGCLMAEDTDHSVVVSIEFPARSGAGFPDDAQGLIKAVELPLVPIQKVRK